LFTHVSGDYDRSVMLYSPEGKQAKPKTKARQSRTVGGITLPEIPDIPDLSSPKIPLAELGKPEDFVPAGLSAWAGRCEGTLLLAACATDSKDPDIVHTLADLCAKLSQEPSEKYEPADEVAEDLKKAAPRGYTFEKRTTWAGMSLWLFRGEQVGKVQDTLIVVHWKPTKSPSAKDLPFVAMANSCQWAAESSVNKKLSAFSADLPEMAIVVKDQDGQYKLSHPFAKTVGQDEEHRFRLSLKDLMTTGKQTGNIHCISFDDILDDHGAVRVSVISRAVSLRSGPSGARETFMVFAGATEATSDKFWHVTRTVDEFVDAWARAVQSR